jgi:hypothetical protein
MISDAAKLLTKDEGAADCGGYRQAAGVVPKTDGAKRQLNECEHHYV